MRRCPGKRVNADCHQRHLKRVIAVRSGGSLSARPIRQHKHGFFLQELHFEMGRDCICADQHAEGKSPLVCRQDMTKGPRPCHTILGVSEFP